MGLWLTNHGIIKVGKPTKNIKSNHQPMAVITSENWNSNIHIIQFISVGHAWRHNTNIINKLSDWAKVTILVLFWKVHITW